MEYLLFLIIVFTGVGCAASELTLRFVFIIEHQERAVARDISLALRSVEESAGVTLAEEVVLLDREDEDQSYRSLCAAVSGGVWAAVEASWAPWAAARRLAAAAGLPLVRAALGVQPLVRALNDYLESRNATDAAIIVDTEAEVDQVLYTLLGASSVRVWAHARLTRDSARALAALRPPPAFTVLMGNTQFVLDTYARAVKDDLVRHAQRWTLVVTEYSAPPRAVPALSVDAFLLRRDQRDCCRLLAAEDGCDCPQDYQRHLLAAVIRHLVNCFAKMDEPAVTRLRCDDLPPNRPGPDPTRPGPEPALYQLLAAESATNDSLFYWDEDSHSVEFRSRFVLSLYRAEGGPQSVAAWLAPQPYSLLDDVTLQPLRMFFRIGTAPAVPWSMPLVDSSGAPQLDGRGRAQYRGYCIDLIHMLAETMEFDYEIVTPARGSFGKRLANGSWDGLVGDLMTGETDMAVGALTMTAEREEVIDFVPPYFEQTGILIVIRKPMRKTSLFKFMTVLRGEVWASVVAALALTGLMIWALDKYSPYSARNNPAAYPYPCRQFTLKESFWFALTSFTPQGGGEAPKAVSGRALVAAYWLFVVLMLATFTANLAAFLTVERMQTPVSSLEQLARQSRINYTVVEGSSVHRYFINMKRAEDTLYRVWKEITLNATSDQAQYRVWDYPIREQYGHILLAINASGPVADARSGFEQVNEHTDADYAFIHDSAEIRYELGRNCNLTEVGGQFAEQPYAVAVAQGSRLQEQVSRALLQLQKERRLEQVAARYWNESSRQSCPDADESEGITLESLGGVFIATLFGLGLAMLTLGWEVFYYKRKEKNKLLPQTAEKPPQKLQSKMAAAVMTRRKRGKIKKVTLGGSFKPVVEKPSVSVISVYPKREYRP